MTRRFLIALSFANLWYAPVWKRLLYYGRSAEFGMKDPPARGEYAAAICGVLLCAVVFVLVDAAFRRGPGLLQRLEIPLGFMLLAMAAQSSLAGSELRVDLLRFVGPRLLLLALALAIVLALLARYHKAVRRSAAPVFLALLPFCAITFGSSLYKIATRTGFADPPHATLLLRGAGPRVLWIIFDEWDQRLTFDARPSGLALPAIDRLRGESLFATNALPPADATILSMPSFIEGRTVRSATPIDAHTLFLEYKDGTRQRFGDEPNLFSEVRHLGMNAAVYGWYLPYCRVFGEYLTDCWWQEHDAYWSSTGRTFASALLTQPRSLIETSVFSPFGQSLTILKHQRTYEELLERSKRAAIDPRMQMTLLHLNVPHAPYFYERASGRMTLANTPSAYPDALALVDRTIAELRAHMEQAGAWNTTAIVFSADHFYRQSPLVNGVRDQRVPFLIHFPGQTTGSPYERPFNTVLTHDLILALLRSEFTDGPSAQNWLDRHVR
jgi:hypothetical protein